MPRITLDLAQTVAIGPFNPHIVEPGWLIRQKICEEAKFEGFDFVSNGDTNEEIFRFGDLEWQVDYSRLAVSVPVYHPSKSSHPGQKVQEVIKLLNHTPVRAIGHNFHFSCSVHEWNGNPLPQLGSNRNPISEGFSPQSFRWVGAYSGKGSRVEVTQLMSNADDIVVLLFNHERSTIPESHDTALDAARMFDSDLSVTRRMLLDMFAVEFNQ